MVNGNLSPREKFRNYLTAHSLRKTPERFALLDKAMTLPGHFGVDILYEAMEASGYHVSRATIYSTLELLVDCGLLNRHLFGARKTSYEMAVGSHFHLICSACGVIREIEEESLSQSLMEMKFPGFNPTYCSTMVYGLCDECAKKSNTKNKDNNADK